MQSTTLSTLAEGNWNMDYKNKNVVMRG